MGLTWVERVDGRNWDGLDTRGQVWATAIRGVEGWLCVINQRGCGLPDGLLLATCATAEEAMAAADRHVVAYVDGLRSGVVEQCHADPAGA